jgi:HAD superfamily hydrolase (TIGR01509 family)
MDLENIINIQCIILSMVSVYLFDLDDTIIDSSIYKRMYSELLREIVSQSKISEIELQKEITRLKAGKDRVDTYELCRSLNCTELYYNLLEKYARHTYSLKTASIPALFKKIRAAKKKIGVVSNSEERTIRIFLDRFNLSVDFVSSGDKLTVLFWINLEKKFNITKDETLLIDDSEEVLEVAKHAGYKTLNVKDISNLEKFGF